MNTRNILIAAPLALLAFAAWSGAAGNATRESIAQICGAEQRPLMVSGDPRLTIENGMGDGGFAIRTTSPQAQAWFNYGIKLFHAFYHADNKVAFDKAVAADPNCAMCLWGQALSRGPTQNFDVNATETKAALEIATKARAAAQGPFETAVTQAMVKRYSGIQNAAAEVAFANDLLAASSLEPKAGDVPLIAGDNRPFDRPVDKDRCDGLSRTSGRAGAMTHAKCEVESGDMLLTKLPLHALD